MDDETKESPMTPTAQRGLPISDEAGIRTLVVAFRDRFEEFHALVDDRLSSIVGGMKTLDARQQVLESDFRQLRSDVSSAKAAAEAARLRADTAHTIAESSARASFDGDGAREALQASLTEARGTLAIVTNQLTELRKNDEDLKNMVSEAAKDSAGAAIREVVGKNPKVVGAVGAVLLVLAQVLTQRFLVPPAAPNQGALPAPTPTVHVEAP